MRKMIILSVAVFFLMVCFTSAVFSQTSKDVSGTDSVSILAAGDLVIASEIALAFTFYPDRADSIILVWYDSLMSQGYSCSCDYIYQDSSMIYFAFGRNLDGDGDLQVTAVHNRYGTWTAEIVSSDIDEEIADHSFRLPLKQDSSTGGVQTNLFVFTPDDLLGVDVTSWITLGGEWARRIGDSRDSQNVFEELSDSLNAFGVRLSLIQEVGDFDFSRFELRVLVNLDEDLSDHIVVISYVGGFVLAKTEFNDLLE